MDQVILAQKLESLRRCIQRVEEKTPLDVEVLIRDPDIQDILVLNLTRAVQLCVDIGSHIISESDEAVPTTMGDVFSSLMALGAIQSATSEALKKAVGFRNVAVHNYDVINWEIVFAICEKSVDDFRGFAKEITDYSQSGKPGT
ncbi:MAG: DUF86 domain-containing protein [Halieaceae bacterium]|nr:DUF86 domain-containing protein [Halieaceae bacterium]